MYIAKIKWYSIPPLVMPSAMKSSLLKKVAFLEGDNLLVFNYLNISEIWLGKRGGILWESSYKRGNTVFRFFF
jgi:hypothetical protein